MGTSDEQDSAQLQRLRGALAGRYAVERELGQGGTATVYLALDEKHDRPVVLKVLRPELASTLAADRFQQEIRVTAHLEHPHILTLHDSGDADGLLYFVLPYVRGESLGERLRRAGRLPVEEAIQIAKDVAGALDHAHRRGVIHRDIKPSNILLSGGHARIADFGVARAVGEAGVGTLTGDGRIVGSPSYMAPEQVSGEGGLDGRLDLYALGCVLYQMLTGQPPYRGETPQEVLAGHLTRPPPSARKERPDVTPALDGVIQRALAKEPEHRFDSGEHFARTLGALETAAGPEKRLTTGLGRRLGVKAALVWVRALARRPGAAHEAGVVGSPGERERPIGALPFRVRRARPAAERLSIPFVARGAEIERLEASLQAAIGGSGRVAFIAGEAGTGKTALAEEFCRRAIETRADLAVAVGRCNAHTGRGDPYLPFREILDLLTGDVEARRAAGSLTHDQAGRLWNLLPVAAKALVDEGPDLIGPFVSPRRLKERVSAYGVRESPWRLDLGRLIEARNTISAAPPTQAALFRQYARVLRAVAARRPLLLVLDDLQWADTGSVDLLFQTGRAVHTDRILIVGLYRPSEVAERRNGDRHPLKSVINELVRRYGDVTVPLPEEGDREFVDAVVDAVSGRMDGEFREILFHHTRGHALFTVELLRGMQEAGTLARNREGRWTRRGALDWRVLPARVEAVIAERIGRLPRELDRLLSVASVEGDVFALETVAALSGFSAGELVPAVAEELERRHHLVRAHGFRQLAASSRSEYRFRHILFQRFLYNRLDPVERAHLHRQVGETLEAQYGDRAPEVSLALARHFMEAGVIDKAVDYLYAAGEQATGAAALPEAVAHFRQAVELVRTLPESPDRDRAELQGQMALGLIYHGVEGHGFSEAESALKRTRELAEKAGDTAQQFRISGSFWAIYHMQARHRAAHGVLTECLALAKAEGDAGLLALAHFWLGINALNRGRPAETLPHLDQFRALYDPTQHRALVFGSWGDPGHIARALKGLALWSLGHPEQAAEHVERVLESARQLGDFVTLYTVLFYEIILRAWRGEPDALARQTDALRTLVREQGLPQLVTLTAFYDGWALAAEERFEEGAVLMEKSLAELEAQQWALWEPYFSALLADAYRRLGRAQEGLELVDRGLGTIEATGERIHEPEQHRIRGELLLAQEESNPVEAEAAFRRALEIARAQEARSYELRAATSLARLLRDTGKLEEARRELRDVYNWFTEGFETADLQEARALLTRLAR